MQRFMLFLCAFALCLTGAADASAKPTRGDRCEASLLKATGKSVHCRIREERHELLRNVTPDFDVCDAALDRAIRRADRRFGSDCPSIEEAQILAGLHAEATETLVGAVTAPPFAPKYHYVAITFDDALRVEDMTLLQPLLALTNPVDDTKAKYTYFVRTASTDFASLENWYAGGNEVANHTVTHDGAQVGDLKQGEIWTQGGKASWLQEMTELDTIAQIWSNVPTKEIVGFRAPNLAGNSNLFLEAFPKWSQGKNAAGKSFVYDSSVPIVPGPTHGFPPPFQPKDCQASMQKYANTDLDAAIKFCESPPSSVTCTQTAPNACAPYWGIEDVSIADFWEIPMPVMLRKPPYDKALHPSGSYNSQSPSDPGQTVEQIMETFDYNYTKIAMGTSDGTKANTPMMIAIHTAWMGENGENNKDALIQWATDLVTSGNPRYDPLARLVSVDQLVAIWATGAEPDEMRAEPTTPARCEYTKGLACHGNAPSTSEGSPDGASCDSQCGSADYGGNPGGTATCDKTTVFYTTTCNTTCGGPVNDQSSANFIAGAAAWIGNPGGNCKTGDTCNYYPTASTPGGGDSCPVAN